MSKKVRVRRAVAALATIAGLAALMPPGAVEAEGTETLGAPSIPIAQGSGIVTDGTGMEQQPGTVNLDVPANATVEQVLVYWEGESRNFAPDNTIRVNGIEVAGTLIGGPTVFYEDVKSTSFRADITSLNAVSPGPNSVSLSDLAFDVDSDGASIAVIYDDTTGPTEIVVRDGNDNAYNGFGGQLNATTPQVFTVTPASFARDAKLSLMVGSVDTGRGSIVRVSSGGVVTDYPNLLGDTDDPQWDDVTLPVNIPANAANVTVEIISADVEGKPAASLTWVAAVLAGPGADGRCPPADGVQAVTHGEAYGVDARVLGGLINVDKLGHVNSVAPGAPSAEATELLSVSVPSLVSAKVLPNSSNSKLNPSTSTASSAVADVSLLGGLVKASTVKAVSQSNASPFGSSFNSNGAVVQGLKVGGVNVAVAPNTKVAVKLLGLITIAELHIMEEKGTSSYANGVSKSSHSMNALRLVLLKSYLGLPAGTQVVVSHAQSDAQSPATTCPDVESVSGEAFTAYVDGDLAGHDLVEVKVGDAVLPPTGGSDADGAVVNIPGVVTSATAANTTTGSLDPNPNARSRSIVEGVNILNGVVTARVLDVRAASTANGTTANTSFATSLLDLKVGGVSVAANAAPNSHFVVDLGALGYVSVVVNEQIVNNSGGTDTEGTVNAVHVRVYTLGGLLTGEVIVASAHSDAHV